MDKSGVQGPLCLMCLINTFVVHSSAATEKSKNFVDLTSDGAIDVSTAGTRPVQE